MFNTDRRTVVGYARQPELSSTIQSLLGKSDILVRDDKDSAFWLVLPAIA